MALVGLKVPSAKFVMYPRVTTEPTLSRAHVAAVAISEGVLAALGAAAVAIGTGARANEAAVAGRGTLVLARVPLDRNARANEVAISWRETGSFAPSLVGDGVTRSPAFAAAAAAGTSGSLADTSVKAV